MSAGPKTASRRGPTGAGTAEPQAFREQPHNTEAEQALLGAILVNNEAALKVSGFLTAEHFFEGVHGRIYEHAMALIERGQHATPVTLKTYFERDEALSEVGGATYLVKLAGSAVGIINADIFLRPLPALIPTIRISRCPLAVRRSSWSGCIPMPAARRGASRVPR